MVFQPSAPNIWTLRVACCSRLFMSISWAKQVPILYPLLASLHLQYLILDWYAIIFFIHVIISFSSSSQFSKSLKILRLFPPVPFWISMSFRFCPSISCNSEPSIFHLHTDSKPPTTLLRCCEDNFNLNRFPLNIPEFFDSKSYISKRWYSDTLKTN